MADFTLIKLQANHGTTLAPSWVDIGGANTSVRWSDSAIQKNIPSANWPFMVRPLATSIVNYTYAYMGDAVGDGFYANGGDCPAYSKDNYLWARWSWDNTGTFGSTPIFTAYPTTGHGAITRGDGSLLGGSNDTKPGASQFSYLKGNAWGRVDSAGAPGVGPTNAPLVTSGTVGAVSPTAGANWLTNFQSLQGDNDYIVASFLPTATTADTWSIHFALFTGPNETPGTYQVVMTLKYTYL